MPKKIQIEEKGKWVKEDSYMSKNSEIDHKLLNQQSFGKKSLTPTSTVKQNPNLEQRKNLLYKPEKKVEHPAQ